MSREPRDYLDEDADSLWRRHGPLAGGLLAVAAIACGLYLFFGKIGGGQPPKPPEVQQISIVQPPPPPPPPPEMEEPPPPEMEEVDVSEPEPEPIAEEAAPDEPLPGDELGLDAEGVAGADGFGLKARKGGRSLIGGGDPKKWYAGVIQTDLQKLLAEVDEIRKGRYAVIVRIWIDDEGRVAQAELERGTGDSTIDKSIESALASGARLSHAPPDDLPQPIRLRISSRS